MEILEGQRCELQLYVQQQINDAVANLNRYIREHNKGRK